MSTGRNLDPVESYSKWVSKWLGETNKERALQEAIGGEFEAIGLIECDVLRQFGLQPNDYLIDVGCGSGRLSKPLSQWLTGKYLGIDIVPELVNAAKDAAARPDWRFEVTKGFSIPERDEKADMVCFFSVFTHLLFEQSYIYLQEAKRVLKPSGKIVFSFLEFRIPSHWAVFESDVIGIHQEKPLNMFIGRDGIEAWAAHLGMHVEAILDGDKENIQLSQPVSLSGRSFTEKGFLGQSVCVLVK